MPCFAKTYLSKKANDFLSCFEKASMSEQVNVLRIYLIELEPQGLMNKWKERVTWF